ncbi:tyrosine-type recombinase/integrase [Thiothrix nivea]|uniref:tyrosine-type recombinase/integrase n=1 Tax=Thiothrix nivea TaxID=1031 RepID=UPI0003130833|nr:integrase arm-type DNA-binding domain-containing protein [Thiothrix nivea]
MERKLTNTKAKNGKTKPGGKPAILTDGGGLFLYVTTLGKYWRYSYRLGGKRQTLSIGSYPEITLEQARELHRKARAQLARGIKPSNPRHTESTADTFQTVALEWFNRSKPGWSESHTTRTESCLRRDVFPWIGKMEVGAVTPSNIIKILQRVESRGAGDTARRVRQIISQIYKYAVTMELTDRNPATDIDTRIILKPLRTR